MINLLLSIVEFATNEEAQGAIKQLSESMFLGRPVYLREVRHALILVTYPYSFTGS